MFRKLLFAAVITLVWNLPRVPSPMFGAIPLRAQTGSDVENRHPWNDAEVMSLLARARNARASLAASGDLRTYRAELRGHVYFFVDPEVGSRHLIRIDQVAAELAWQAPDRLRQRILGERSEERLPVREFDYYPDRLTLVPYGFGDEIRIGSGRDVAGVPHPIAPPPTPDGSEVYDFRLGDSLTISVAGRDEPVRIQEVAVRPRDPARPAMLGTVLLDRDTGSIVRMAFTFTPASYVDPRNDRVEVELDYGLWEDRYWLPNLQRIEVRREIPALDLGVGTTIRSVLHVGGYELNSPQVGDLPPGASVTLAPLSERTAYPFSEGLYDAVEDDGLADLVVDSDIRELRTRAMELLGSAPPSGLARTRLHVPNVSSLLRYDRAEGLRAGIGASFRTLGGATLRGTIGYATAAEYAESSLGLEAPLAPDWSVSVDARVRNLGDLGLTAASAPLVSSLAAAIRAEDYLDPFWVSGASFRISHLSRSGGTLDVGFGIERHSNASRLVDDAPLGASRSFRAVRVIDEGEFFSGVLGMSRTLGGPGGARGWGRLEAKLLQGQVGGGIGINGEIEESWGPPSRASEIRLRAIGWAWAGDALPQGHRLLGGRETLPGYRFREFVGTRAMVASLVGSADVGGSFLSLRSGLYVGWAQDGDPTVASSWGARGTRGVRGAVSVGVGLGWDLLHLDLARGWEGGEWQLLLSVDRDWWDWL